MYRNRATAQTCADAALPLPFQFCVPFGLSNNSLKISVPSICHCRDVGNHGGDVEIDLGVIHTVILVLLGDDDVLVLVTLQRLVVLVAVVVVRVAIVILFILTNTDNLSSNVSANLQQRVLISNPIQNILKTNFCSHSTIQINSMRA